MGSLHHLVIMGIADYPAYDSSGNQVGTITCGIDDRIWCAFELAIRDCLAVKVLGHQKSEVVVLDEMAKQVVRGALSGSSVAAKISESCRNESVFDRLQGQPVDVAEIKALLVSDAFYGSVAAFDNNYRKRMVRMLAENAPQVHCIPLVIVWVSFDLAACCCSFCSIRRTRWTWSRSALMPSR
jgi:hypothetical protein